MFKDETKFLEHLLVRQIYESNESFYLAVARENYPIERFVNCPNRKKEDVIKVVAFGILGNLNYVVTLLNKYNFGWLKAF